MLHDPATIGQSVEPVSQDMPYDHQGHCAELLETLDQGWTTARGPATPVHEAAPEATKFVSLRSNHSWRECELKIRFMSGNAHKILEAERILARSGVTVIPISKKVEELQTEDVEALVKDKAIKAFEAVGRPLFVEHTGLYLAGLNGLPAGLTQIFWDRLQADRFSSLVSALGNSQVTAKTVLGYCDGYRIHLFEGSVEGTVPAVPAGPSDFQWDCVFIPKGHTLTFAEMGDAKDAMSMRRKALDLFTEYLENRTGRK